MFIELCHVDVVFDIKSPKEMFRCNLSSSKVDVIFSVNANTIELKEHCRSNSVFKHRLITSSFSQLAHTL